MSCRLQRCALAGRSGLGAGHQFFAEPTVQTADDFNEGSGLCCMQKPIQEADRPSPPWAGKAGDTGLHSSSHPSSPDYPASSPLNLNFSA